MPHTFEDASGHGAQGSQWAQRALVHAISSAGSWIGRPHSEATPGERDQPEQPRTDLRRHAGSGSAIPVVLSRPPPSRRRR